MYIEFSHLFSNLSSIFITKKEEREIWMQNLSQRLKIGTSSEVVVRVDDEEVY